MPIDMISKGSVQETYVQDKAVKESLWAPCGLMIDGMARMSGLLMHHRMRLMFRRGNGEREHGEIQYPQTRASRYEDMVEEIIHEGGNTYGPNERASEAF